MDNNEILAGVERALESVRSYLQSHAGDVSLVSIEDSIVYVRLSGTCVGCPMSLFTLTLGIEEAVKREVSSIQAVKAVE